MDDNRIIKVFVDEDPEPFAEFSPPVKFLFDTTRLPDGPHMLKIVARSSGGQEGIRRIPFEVRNGPAISVVGLRENEIIERSEARRVGKEWDSTCRSRWSP